MLGTNPINKLSPILIQVP